MTGMTPSKQEKLSLTDERTSNTYLQQLRAMDLDALERPIQSRVLLLTSTKFLGLAHKIEEQISIEWDQTPPAKAFQRTQPSIEAFLKLARQADRFVRLSHELQSDQRGTYPSQPR